MGTLNIPCTGGTFLSYVFPTANNSSMTALPTSAEFMRCRTTSVESSKVYYSKRDRLAEHADHTDLGGCILEFTRDPLLDYKSISSVKLHFTYKSTVINSSGNPTLENLNGSYLNNRKPYWHEFIYDYYTSKQLSQINLENFAREGSYYLNSYEDLHDIIPTGVTSYNREINLGYIIPKLMF